MIFSLGNALGVPPGGMSGITGILANFCGFCWFLNKRKNFFWPLSRQTFKIDLCFTTLDPDSAIFWSIKSKKQEKRAKMKGSEKTRFRIDHTEIFCSNWFHAFFDSFGKYLAHKNLGTKNKILPNQFFKIRAPYFFSFFVHFQLLKKVLFGP